MRVCRRSPFGNAPVRSAAYLLVRFVFHRYHTVCVCVSATQVGVYRGIMLDTRVYCVPGIFYHCQQNITGYWASVTLKPMLGIGS